MRAVRHVLFLGSVLSLAACGGAEQESTLPSEELGQTGAPLMRAEPSLRVEGAYIIKLKDGVDSRAVAALAGVAPRHAYAILNGFAADLTPAQLTALRANPLVEYVEEDAVVHPTVSQTSAPCGLDRIDQRNLPLDGIYNANSTGSGVTAYIIDTGILTSHTQFGGRAAVAYDAVGGNGQDCNGHGTYVAGIVGGSTYGVAKGVSLRAVRVLDCTGAGTTSGAIAGIDWVRANHVAKSVATLSLGGGFSSTMNTAVTNLVNSGVFLAVGAGNGAADACNYSPASATSIMTVAASTCADARVSSSNYGSCVDLYAPGASITSAWSSSTTAANTLSGTSSAAPFVTGVAALYKATYGDVATATLNTWLVNNATPNVITGNPTGTPNLLLYKSTL